MVTEFIAEQQVRSAAAGILAVCAVTGDSPEGLAKKILRKLPASSEGARVAREAAEGLLTGKF